MKFSVLNSYPEQIAKTKTPTLANRHIKASEADILARIEACLKRIQGTEATIYSPYVYNGNKRVKQAQRRFHGVVLKFYHPLLDRRFTFACDNYYDYRSNLYEILKGVEHYSNAIRGVKQLKVNTLMSTS